MPIDPRVHFQQLALHVANLLKGYEPALATTKEGNDPVALDKFAIHCKALAEACGQAADRAEQLAGVLLDR